MSEKIKKLIELDPDCKKRLSINAAHAGKSLKAYIEQLCKADANSLILPEDGEEKTEKPAAKPKKKPKPKPKKTPEPPAEEAKPSEVTDSEPQEEPKIKETEKVGDSVISTRGEDYTDIGDPTISKQEKKGAFARAEPQVYTNGKIWEYRGYDTTKREMVQKYYRTKEEAIAERDKDK